jgi:hypothetical protein
VTEVNPEYAQQVLEYEKTAFEAAQSGDYATASQVWQAILDDSQMRAVFEADNAAMQELVWNLALAYGGSQQKEKGDALVATYGLDANAYAAAFGGGS